ncbi:MAG: helix-turn-helix transcriptional regulator [Bacteroidia bacterium]|nr:helix-turn-helix transcriptional regulator [Bacteroidia bacterium]
MDGTSIYTELRKARILKGYSQEYVGLKLGITQNYYSKIERKQCKISVEMLLSLCNLLDIKPAELFSCMEGEKKAAG